MTDIPKPKETQRERQARYQAKLDAMSPLEQTMWKLERAGVGKPPKGGLYSKEEQDQLLQLAELVKAAQFLAEEINRSVTARLKSKRLTSVAGALLVELATKKVRFTLSSH